MIHHLTDPRGALILDAVLVEIPVLVENSEVNDRTKSGPRCFRVCSNEILTRQSVVELAAHGTGKLAQQADGVPSAEHEKKKPMRFSLGSVAELAAHGAAKLA